MTDTLRDDLAEQAFGVLVAATEDGTTNWNVVAHAIVGNQLPVVERYAQIARIEGRAEALNAAWHEVEDDEDAQLLAHRAVEWEREAAGLRTDALGPQYVCPTCESPYHDPPCPRLAADGMEPHPAHRQDETEAGR